MNGKMDEDMIQKYFIYQMLCFELIELNCSKLVLQRRRWSKKRTYFLDFVFQTNKIRSRLGYLFQKRTN